MNRVTGRNVPNQAEWARLGTDIKETQDRLFWDSVNLLTQGLIDARAQMRLRGVDGGSLGKTSDAAAKVRDYAERFEHLRSAWDGLSGGDAAGRGRLHGYRTDPGK